MDRRTDGPVILRVLNTLPGFESLVIIRKSSFRVERRRAERYANRIGIIIAGFANGSEESCCFPPIQVNYCFTFAGPFTLIFIEHFGSLPISSPEKARGFVLLIVFHPTKYLTRINIHKNDHSIRSFETKLFSLAGTSLPTSLSCLAVSSLAFVQQLHKSHNAVLMYPSRKANNRVQTNRWISLNSGFISVRS
jgi:hypothetical protein